MRSAVARGLVGTGPEYIECKAPTIPDHVLLDRIGIGAYGEVWVARNTLGTLRAVKIVYRVRFEDDRPYQREFHGILKYEPISRTHEGLVQILHVGRNDEIGCFYYVMELGDDSSRPASNAARRVAGGPNPEEARAYVPRTLRSELRHHRRLPPDQAARISFGLAGALAHLHAQGLVHRDIKPSNIIFVGGEPKLADIGLVTGAGDSRSFVGTEGFIPPEGPGTQQADLYGLGKLLYELATGRDRLEFPQLPEDISVSTDSESLLELNEVVTRACAPDPADRYTAATEMQAELSLFLAGRSLRQARKARRHLMWLKRLALTAGVFLVLSGVGLWLARNEVEGARQRERIATALRERAEVAEHESRNELYAALLEQARATVRSGELGQRVRALDAIGRAASITNTADLRREAFTAFALPDLRFEREIPNAEDVTFSVLNSAFERIALFRGKGAVEIRGASDQKLVATLPPRTEAPAYFGKWSSDGRFIYVKRDLISGGSSADVEVWEVAAQHCVLEARNVPFGLAGFHPKLPRILVGRADKSALIWDLETNAQIARFPLGGAPELVMFSPDGERFATASPGVESSLLLVNDAATGAPLLSKKMTNYVRDLNWHPDGRWLSECDDGSMVHLIDSRTGEMVELGRHRAQSVSAAFSPDGNYAITGGWERELTCWDLRTMQRAFSIGLESYIAQFRSDGRECAVYTGTGVRIYEFEEPHNRVFPEDLGGPLKRAVFSTDGRWLAASGTIRLGVWDFNRGGPGALANEGADARIFFTAAGDLVASGETAFSQWRIAPAKSNGPPQLQRLALPKSDGFASLCVVSNALILTGPQGSRVLRPDSMAADDVGWSPTSPGINGASSDGRWLGIFGSYTPVLDVYRLPGFERAASLTNQANIGTFDFSQLGDEVTLTSQSGIEFWSTRTWKRTRRLTNCISLLYTPNARAWWLARDLRTSGLYDSQTLEAKLLLPSWMFPLAVSPDGKWLAVSVDGRRLQAWDLAWVREQFRDLGVDWTGQ
jgi:WD40 repeat protein